MLRLQDLPLDIDSFRATRVSDYERGGERFVNAIRIVGRDRAAHAIGAHIYRVHGIEWIILEQAAVGRPAVFECLWFHDACERSATLAGAEERLYRHIAGSAARVPNGARHAEQPAPKTRAVFRPETSTV